MNEEGVNSNNEIENPAKDIQQNREEILQKRKDRRAQKREEKKLNKEKSKLEQKLNKKSEKIQIISVESFQKVSGVSSGQSSVTTASSSRQIKLRNKILRHQGQFNLLDYIVEKKKDKKSLKKVFSSSKQKTSIPIIKLNRGKKREIRKKKYTRLRKIILRNRQIKKEHVSGTVIEDKKQKNKKENDNKTNDENKLLGEFEKLEISNEDKQIIQKIVPLEMKSTSKPIHSRKFQIYCDNTTSKELCNLTENLLRELFRFQKRAYDKNQIKACAHRRYVVGFNEVKRQLDILKTKLIIFAPDCENCDLPGGIIDIINEMKIKCKNSEIPYLFACNRRHLGYILFKKVPVSCIAILNYDGAQNIFHALIDCLEQERKNYNELIKNVK